MKTKINTVKYLAVLVALLVGGCQNVHVVPMKQPRFVFVEQRTITQQEHDSIMAKANESDEAVRGVVFHGTK